MLRKFGINCPMKPRQSSSKSHPLHPTHLAPASLLIPILPLEPALPAPDALSNLHVIVLMCTNWLLSFMIFRIFVRGVIQLMIKTLTMVSLQFMKFILRDQQRQTMQGTMTTPFKSTHPIGSLCLLAVSSACCPRL